MSEVQPEDRAQTLWHDLIDKEQQFFAARIALLESGINLEALIDRALMDPDQRGAALRQLTFLQEPRLRQFVPTLLDIALKDQRFAQPVRRLIRSLDEDWLAGQLPRVIELFLGKELPESEVEGQRTAAFLYALDPRLHAAFEQSLAARGS